MKISLVIISTKKKINIQQCFSPCGGFRDVYCLLRVEGEEGVSDAMDMNLGKLWKMVRDRKAWRAADHRVTKSQKQMGD